MRTFDTYLSSIVLSTNVEEQSCDETLPKATRDLLPLIKELQGTGMIEEFEQNVFKLSELNWQ